MHKGSRRSRWAALLVLVGGPAASPAVSHAQSWSSDPCADGRTISLSCTGRQFEPGYVAPSQTWGPSFSLGDSGSVRPAAPDQYRDWYWNDQGAWCRRGSLGQDTCYGRPSN